MANTGNIVKSKCDKDFTVIFNHVLRDDKISLRARGLLLYILSLPDDWVIHKTSLDQIIFPNVERIDQEGRRVQGEKREGRDAVFSAFNELVEFGYIQAIRKINASTGRCDGYDYIVYNKPIEQGSDNPITGFPITDKPSITKEIDIQSKEITKKEINKESWEYREFIEMVNNVSNKKYRGDSKSKKSFLARLKDGYTIADMEKALRSAMLSKFHIETNFVYLTPEFLTRPDKLETYINAYKEPVKPMTDEQYREFIGR